MIAAVLLLSGAPASAQLLDFSQDEVRRILRHGPWPPPWTPDPSNRVSGNAAAIALGRALFFEPRLSGTATVQCSSCHIEARAWQDGRVTGAALARLDRNTPSIHNARYHRWFGWDGANDSLWAQSIRPLLDAREMGASAAHVAGLLRGHGELRRLYVAAFGAPPPADDEAALVDAAKALAAFQETLVSGRAPFDEFRDALAKGDRAAAARYPAAAQRGLRIFVGKGNCSVCHFGPGFTHGEFADIGIPFFIERGRVDSGRHGGIARLRRSRFNLLGTYNDDPRQRSAVATRHVVAQHRNFGEFRVPGLRDAARTAPYMHNGSLATLGDVVRHYAELDPERLHSDGERILRPLALRPNEIDDLVAFLESLSETAPGDRAAACP